ncbi:MAG TPA: hypothetical protein VFU15_01220 [Bacteroidia bacterium]|nr:hypothetical protein [Bacteroidia bacterium]
MKTFLTVLLCVFFLTGVRSQAPSRQDILRQGIARCTATCVSYVYDEDGPTVPTPLSGRRLLVKRDPVSTWISVYTYNDSGYCTTLEWIQIFGKDTMMDQVRNFLYDAKGNQSEVSGHTILWTHNPWIKGPDSLQTDRIDDTTYGRGNYRVRKSVENRNGVVSVYGDSTVTPASCHCNVIYHFSGRNVYNEGGNRWDSLNRNLFYEYIEQYPGGGSRETDSVVWLPHGMKKDFWSSYPLSNSKPNSVIVTTRDSAGNVICEERITDTDHSVDSVIYNDKGSIIRKAEYDGNGKKIAGENYFYRNDTLLLVKKQSGNSYSEIHYGVTRKNNQVTYDIRTFETDRQDYAAVAKNWNANAKGYTQREIQVYDVNGNLLSDKIYDKDGLPVNKTFYTYETRSFRLQPQK